MWVTDTRSVRVGKAVFFKHRYLMQPAMTQSDAILRASDNLCQVVKGLPPVKGDTRKAVDILMDIFRNHGKNNTKIDDQRANMNWAAA